MAKESIDEAAAKFKPEDPVMKEKIRIFIVDDDNATLELLNSYFSSCFEEGLLAVTFSSKIECAFMFLKHEYFDILLADLHLADFLGIDGIDLIAYSKKRWPDQYAALMTSDTAPQVEDKLYQKGGDQFIKKPFDFGEIESMVENVISHARSEECRCIN
jgi:DNA-binding NtrC family response regulator